MSDARPEGAGERERPATLLDLVRALREAPEARGVTFIDDRFRETCWSWRRLHDEASCVARELAGHGVRPGALVVTPLTSGPEALATFLGVVLAGAVPATVPGRGALPERAAEDRIERLVRHHRFRTVLRPDRPAAAGSSMLREAEPLAGARVFDVALGSPERLTDGLPERLTDGLPERSTWGRGPAVRRRGDDLALVQFSSGTTRTPRGVELTHDAVLANVALAVETDHRDERAVHVSWLPLCHDMGLVGALLATLPAAHDLVLLDPACFVLRPIAWLEALSRHRATSTAAPNFALAVTAERVSDAQLRRRQLDLSPLRSVFDGAEPVRALTVRRFEERLREHGLRPGTVRPVYGLAEATLLVTAPERDEPLRTRTVEGVEVPSVGRPVGDFKLRIADPESDRQLPPGTVGEIHVRGRSLARGYHGDEAATARAFRDGWLRTGDLGLIDEEGRLHVTGRLKDLLIVAGRNVYAHEVGDCVDELPFARRGHSLAVSVPRSEDESAGEEIVVLLAPASRVSRWLGGLFDDVAALARGLPGAGPALEGAALRAGRLLRQLVPAMGGRRRLDRLARRVDPIVRGHLQQQLGLPVDRVELVPRLPKTTSGKVRRAECERLALERRAARS